MASEAPKTKTKPNTENNIVPIDSQEKNTSGVYKHIDLPDIDYDIDLLTEFVHTVFGEAIEGVDESALFWRAKFGNAPKFPVPFSELVKRASRSKTAGAFYYGTATCRFDEVKGGYFNRQELFEALYVVVLDDIGTKIPVEKIPEDLKPTYIIESSEGNFQYGYVLENPIEDLETAKLLVQYIYDSGLTDAGGAMPNKLVRLPMGVNGKPKKSGTFEVTLRHMDGPLWDVQKLLDAAGLDINWQAASADVKNAMRKRTRSAGTSVWAAHTPKAALANGIIDPVLEWLYEQDMVYQDNGDWVTIKCPNSHNHTSGDDTAGYMPIGRGSNPQRRAYNCFHDHCRDLNTPWFLQQVRDMGGPKVGVEDPVADLVAEYVYDTAEDACWRVKGVDTPQKIKTTAFRNLHATPVNIMADRGANLTSKAAASLFFAAPNKVVVHGGKYDPSTTDRLIWRTDTLYLNDFSPPLWGDGEIPDQADVDTFKGYLEYLIPSESEREYFTDWLACKAQNGAFRGAGMLMVAKAQGTGRGTLADMLTVLFGEHNCAEAEFQDFIGNGSQFNEWKKATLVFTHEVKDNNTVDKYRAYEVLKRHIEPRARLEMVNNKYGAKTERLICSSHLMFTNHPDAMAFPAEDRRMYVITNTAVPASIDYFADINRWIDERDNEGKPKWCVSVWRWLLQREVDAEKMSGRAPLTLGKTEMLNTNTTDVQSASEKLIELWPREAMSLRHIEGFMRDHLSSIVNLAGSAQWDKQLKKVFTSRTTALNAKTTFKLGVTTIRPRFRNAYAQSKKRQIDFIENPAQGSNRVWLKDQLDPLTEQEIEALCINVAEFIDTIEA